MEIKTTSIVKLGNASDIQFFRVLLYCTMRFLEKREQELGRPVSTVAMKAHPNIHIPHPDILLKNVKGLLDLTEKMNLKSTLPNLLERPI